MEEPNTLLGHNVGDAQATREAANPLLYCIISTDAMQATEARLYALPELCERVMHAEGIEELVLSQEISVVKRALSTISDDPYYPLIPAKYFSRAKERTVAALACCDKATVWRNRKRLLEALTLRLYGVSAWYKTSSL